MGTSDPRNAATKLGVDRHEAPAAECQLYHTLCNRARNLELRVTGRIAAVSSVVKRDKLSHVGEVGSLSAALRVGRSP
jgi:hypothetical protein